MNKKSNCGEVVVVVERNFQVETYLLALVPFFFPDFLCNPKTRLPPLSKAIKSNIQAGSQATGISSFCDSTGYLNANGANGVIVTRTLELGVRVGVSGSQ